MRWLFLEIQLLAFGARIALTQQIAPGIELPSHGDVWVLDSSGSAGHLVRLKYSVVHVNLHRGANFGRSMAWPVGGRIQNTVEISGAAATARVSNNDPVFYVRSILADPEEAAVITAPGAKLALLRLRPEKDVRVLETLAYTQLSGAAHAKDDAIKLSLERIPDTDWLKAIPAQPLAAGEYALTWVATKANDASFPEIVYDFGVAGSAAQQQATP